MNVIIFSKDRAAQLDLLLRSMPEDFGQVFVIYKASSDAFMDGYENIFKMPYPNYVQIGYEEDFKRDVYNMADTDHFSTMFLTDDDVFLRDISVLSPTFNSLVSDLVSCISLRLNPHMAYCYTLNREQKKPRMEAIKDGWAWNWRLADADYGYPMSLDGHIFRTADILPLLENLDYHDPNSLEAALARNPINRPMMMCFDKSVIVNNPINRVQDTIKNRHGNVSAEWLNEQFLAGRRIKLEPFIGIEPNACHVELPIEWE